MPAPVCIGVCFFPSIFFSMFRFYLSICLSICWYSFVQVYVLVRVLFSHVRLLLYVVSRSFLLIIITLFSFTWISSVYLFWFCFFFQPIYWKKKKASLSSALTLLFVHNTLTFLVYFISIRSLYLIYSKWLFFIFLIFRPLFLEEEKIK